MTYPKISNVVAVSHQIMNNQASFYLSEEEEFDEGKPEPSKKAIDTLICTS